MTSTVATGRIADENRKWLVLAAAVLVPIITGSVFIGRTSARIDTLSETFLERIQLRDQAIEQKQATILAAINDVRGQMQREVQRWGDGLQRSKESLMAELSNRDSRINFAWDHALQFNNTGATKADVAAAGRDSASDLKEVRSVIHKLESQCTNRDADLRLMKEQLVSMQGKVGALLGQIETLQKENKSIWRALQLHDVPKGDGGHGRSEHQL